ncbi:hypothetical protein [Marilutibacter alkalisoli]|uniref:Uncharacterized protein n=1 Tax=Marilutibacter alkalisoli TaxID=2591633 RepID=A0A514BS88_9GAMM|nr:hypothetical protein [Lysobacter alkalisoli]QDH70230.1 hypothetical protein FKV23_09090 [Lysobacter alkalisoli]
MTSNQIALIRSASDSILIDRLFAMARSESADNDELAIIDAEVYERFASSYEQPLDEMAAGNHLIA